MSSKKLVPFALALSFSTGALALETPISEVPVANPKAAGMVAPNMLSRELGQMPVAVGAMKLENPTGNITHYGYLGNGPLIPILGDVQSTTHNVEASKTEPDKNVYLILPDQVGPDTGYYYGSHFLFQGHEAGAGYLTRINLDADPTHRVTLMASTDVAGKALPTFDGITWNPFTQRLLLTAELGANGGVWQATADFPSKVEDISGVLGRGGYEGIQLDGDGNIWIVEDVGGKNGTVNKSARQPNSFLYRFVPNDAHNTAAGGKLQALQVMSRAHAGPIVFHASDPDGDILSQDMKDLHTYGLVFDTNWVTIHDTARDGNTPFDANALAKTAGATPFKRPENGVFRPDTKFGEFYFTETGDTNANTEAGSEYGGFGGVFKLMQTNPSANVGQLTIHLRGDKAHTGFDNIAFWSDNRYIVVEDAGDNLHGQRNALDSAYMADIRVNYAVVAPLRILAQGRDPSATMDSMLLANSGTGFQNDGDNEITGIHISDGDPSEKGLLGGKDPKVFQGGRVFYTQQHGDNITWEITPSLLYSFSPWLP